jgi:hypothetical protein
MQPARGFYGSQMPAPRPPLVPSFGPGDQAPTADSQSNQFFASMGHLFHDSQPTSSRGSQQPNHYGASDSDADLNLFAGPSLRSDMSTAMRSWCSLFTVQEITTAVAGYSLFSPHVMPFRTMSRSSTVLNKQPLPGLSQSSLKSSKTPPYYPASDAACFWVPDAPVSFNGLGVLPVSGASSSAASTDFVGGDGGGGGGGGVGGGGGGGGAILRKRSRELNLASRGTLEQDEVSAFDSCAKLTRVPTSLPPHDAPLLANAGAQDGSCRTCVGAAPVVDIHVPSVCECGTVIVGVWYRSRPYYSHWFRHPRYAALRCMLEQNRCNIKCRPACIHATARLASPGTDKNGNRSVNATCHECCVAVDDSGLEAVSCESIAASTSTSQDNFGALMPTDDILAPEFMSLLCMFQLLKDAVGVMYPSTLPNAAAPPHSKADHVRISAHTDCERSKGFVQYRWHSSDVNHLIKDLTCGDKNTRKVVGCCCLAHWKRKPPGQDPSQSVNPSCRRVELGQTHSALQSSQLIVNAALDVQNVWAARLFLLSRLILSCVYSVDTAHQVYSPFELDCERPPSLGLCDIPTVSVMDWESLDHSVWATCRSLLLLPAEVVEACMQIPFCKEEHVSHSGSVYCGKHCDISSSIEQGKASVDAEVEQAAGFSNEVLMAATAILDT